MARGERTHSAVSGAGLGLRSELNVDLLRNPRAVDFAEVVVEACLAAPQARREAAAMAELWPVIPHGIKLSLGSADGIEVDRARRVGALARELRAPMITEHVAFVRGGAREIGHLTPLPYTRDAVKVVAKNVAEARKHLPDVPLLLENIAWTFRWPQDAMGEADFYCQIVEATGCELLLDLGNLYANALNDKKDPAAVLDQFPLERVSMVHLAGGVHEHGFYLDTHAHPIPDGVFALLDRLCERRGQVPVVIERDSQFPPFAALEAELVRSRQSHRLGKNLVEPAPPAPPPPWEEASPGSLAALLDEQQKLALLLVGPDAPGPEAQARYGAADLARSREILRRKRVDDALPLLPRLQARRELLEPLAYRCVADAPRTERLAAIADAMRIAEGAESHEQLRAAALVDGLVLKARFRLEDNRVIPRATPFIKQARLPDGQRCWVLKGVGAGASVRLIESGR